MKVLLLRLLAVVVCGMWVPTAAQEFFTGPCPKILPMKNFKPDRFLGRWYEIQRFFVSYEGLAGTCWVENYLKEPGRGYFTRLDWKDHLTGKVLNIENGITFDKYVPAKLRYVVQRPPVPLLQGQYSILATDYSSFALAWQCDNFPLGTGHTEILWFLSRQQYPMEYVIRSTRTLAASLGLDIRRLVKQERYHCPP